MFWHSRIQVTTRIFPLPFSISFPFFLTHTIKSLYFTASFISHWIITMIKFPIKTPFGYFAMQETLIFVWKNPCGREREASRFVIWLVYCLGGRLWSVCMNFRLTRLCSVLHLDSWDFPGIWECGRSGEGSGMEAVSWNRRLRRVFKELPLSTTFPAFIIFSLHGPFWYKCISSYKGSVRRRI